MKDVTLKQRELAGLTWRIEQASKEWTRFQYFSDGVYSMDAR